MDEKKLKIRSMILINLFIFLLFIGVAIQNNITINHVKIPNIKNIEYQKNKVNLSENRYLLDQEIINKLYCNYIEWNKTYGGNKDDWSFFVQQTSDNGLILCGLTQSYAIGSDDVWLIKTDCNGIELWNKTYGGKGSDRGYCVHQTNDDCYLITGYTSSFGAQNLNLWLIKTDNNGNELWNKTFGGDSLDWGYSIIEAVDGGFIIVGHTSSFGIGQNDIWLIKIDEEGNQQWDNIFGGEGNDIAYNIKQTIDRGYIIVGSTTSNSIGQEDVWLIKTNEYGIKLWDQIFGGVYFEEGYAVEQTYDEGFIIVGCTSSFGERNTDLLLIKTDLNGRKEWSNIIGNDNEDIGFSVDQTNDKGFVLTGYTDSFGNGMSDIWVIKTSDTGIVQWFRVFGGKFRDRGFSIIQINDGEYIITGLTMSFGAGGRDTWLMKVNEPIIDIDVLYGLGIKVKIKNNGEDKLSDVKWSISLKGKIFLTSNQDGIISNIESGSISEIRLFLMGIGPGHLYVTVNDVSTLSDFFMIGPFIIRYSPWI